MTVDDRRGRLGQRVRERRMELGLSSPVAADRAGINRDTWRNLEAGTRAIRDYNHRPIERALNWQAGSIDAILAGGEPILAESAAYHPNANGDAYTDPETGEVYDDPDERALWDRRGLPEETRRELIYYLRTKRAAHRRRDPS